TEARGLDPKDAAAYSTGGAACRSKGNLDQAIADYDMAIRVDPKNAPAYYNRGLAYGRRHDLDRAIADFDEAIRLDPKDVAPRYQRGLAWSSKNKFDRAIADFDEAIGLDPKHAAAYNARCWSRAITGRALAAALADCNEALRLRPGDGNMLNSRALVQFKLGAYDRAIADFGAAAAKDP